MLALKSTRLVPLLSNCGGVRQRSTLIMATKVSKLRTDTMSPVAVAFHKNFITDTILARACALSVSRAYSTPSSSSSSPSSPSSPSPSSSPSPPNLPDKQQMEKYFFRVVAFVWDMSYFLFVWSKKNFSKFVVENSTVQLYWKEFQKKMEKARKD